ncbi:Nse1 non-SMC component of SMC5-6 complex-domain-containing protein [Apiosordaria backusii]|uniref:Non-structural maintenance of chromosomes element 1 homolog n=1 Tax=Apiosordaria backusii TaxID=314023 RepID=A0AA40DSW6_9PEZI|nr:Nse1 non-SMC component of SMC5-6 complex-domain-containing protein [Apiosordaria backusii]
MDIDWEPPLPAGYNDLNRTFIQNFMAQGTLTFTEGRRLLADLKSKTTFEPVDPNTITLEQFTDAVRTAREAIEPLDYDIRYMRDQVRNERVWVFYNTQSDPASQMATVHTAEEVAYIKRLLDAMFETYNTPRMEVMAVDEGQALKVSRPARQSMANGHLNGVDGEDVEGSQAAATRGLKHSEVLALLSSLVAEGWLEKSRDGFYSLSTRSLVELWSWLVATYNDEEEDWQHIKFCEACKEIVTHGQRCTNVDCIIRLHDGCGEGFWRTRPDKKCPKCQTDWDGNHFVGERAVTSRSAFQRSRGGGGRRGRRSEVAEDAAEDEAED